MVFLSWHRLAPTLPLNSGIQAKICYVNPQIQYYVNKNFRPGQDQPGFFQGQAAGRLTVAAGKIESAMKRPEPGPLAPSAVRVIVYPEAFLRAGLLFPRPGNYRVPCLLLAAIGEDERILLRIYSG